MGGYFYFLFGLVLYRICFVLVWFYCISTFKWREGQHLGRDSTSRIPQNFECAEAETKGIRLLIVRDEEEEQGILGTYPESIQSF